MIKLYLVLSVNECQQLLDAARESSREADGPVNRSHCVVLDLDANPEIVSDDGRMQIISSSFLREVRKIEDENSERYRSSLDLPKQETELDYSGV
jgi:hypothetical protein